MAISSVVSHQRASNCVTAVLIMAGHWGAFPRCLANKTRNNVEISGNIFGRCAARNHCAGRCASCVRRARAVRLVFRGRFRGRLGLAFPRLISSRLANPGCRQERKCFFRWTRSETCCLHISVTRLERLRRRNDGRKPGTPLIDSCRSTISRHPMAATQPTNSPLRLLNSIPRRVVIWHCRPPSN